MFKQIKKNIENNSNLIDIIAEQFLNNNKKLSLLLEDNKKDQVQLSSILIQKLISNIKLKYNKLNLKEIELSGGNFNKLKNKDYIINCIKYFENFNQEKKNEDIAKFNLVLNKTVSVLTNSDIIKGFEEGFQTQNDFIKMLYSSVCLNLIIAVSSIISMIVTYIKAPDNSYFAAFSTEYSSDIEYIELLIDNLNKFNNCYQNSKLFIIFKNMNQIQSLNNIPASKNEEGVLFPKRKKGIILNESIIGVIGTIGLSAIAIITTILILVNTIRLIIYLYYKIKMQLSILLAQQADLLEFNSQRLDPKKDKAIIQRQQNIVKQLNKFSAKFRVELKESIHEAEKEIEKENKTFEREIKSEYSGENQILI